MASHAIVWCILPQMHRQSSWQWHGCGSNVIYSTKRTIFVRTSKLVNHIGAPESISALLAVSYHELARFSVFVINCHSQSTCCVDTRNVMYNDIAYSPLIYPVRRWHMVFVVKMNEMARLACLSWTGGFTFHVLFDFVVYCLYYLCNGVAVVHKYLFDPAKFHMQQFPWWTIAYRPSKECSYNAISPFFFSKLAPRFKIQFENIT